ncbi:MAG: hypothetical protein JSU03_09110 [Bacteroidetes bacterium]|nr:hypothetical protein [Bacteroidota bacterium]MBS1757423.1 hypothetical protein [Bacteroidota bacterium]
MIGTFKANNPYNNFLLFVYGFILKFPLFLYPKAPQVNVLDGILYKYLLQFLEPLGHTTPFIYSIITYLLLYVQALGFNKAVNTQRLFQKPNYLTGMSYLLITSLFAEWFSLSAPLIINTMLIWVWSKLCTLHNEPNPKTSIFNIGFVISICAFLYFPAIAFILLVMTGLTIARPFKLREWLIGLVGIITPFYFFASWLFLTDRIQTYHLPAIAITLPAFKEGKIALVTLILILCTVLAGFFFINNNFRRQVVQTRKSWQLIFLYLLVALLIPFLNATHSFSNWILIAVPVSLFTAGSFLYPDKKWFPQTMHWGMVAIAIAIGYFIK